MVIDGCLHHLQEILYVFIGSIDIVRVIGGTCRTVISRIDHKDQIGVFIAAYLHTASYAYLCGNGVFYRFVGSGGNSVFAYAVSIVNADKRHFAFEVVYGSRQQNIADFINAGDGIIRFAV